MQAPEHDVLTALNAAATPSARTQRPFGYVNGNRRILEDLTSNRYEALSIMFGIVVKQEENNVAAPVGCREARSSDVTRGQSVQH